MISKRKGKSWTVGGTRGRIEMGPVGVQRVIALRSKTKRLIGLVLVIILCLRSRSLLFCYCYYCFLVQGQSNVLFCSSWFCSFGVLVYAGWISGVRLWTYSFVRTSGHCTSFHSQQSSSNLMSLSTVVANWLSLRASREVCILKSRLVYNLLHLEYL